MNEDNLLVNILVGIFFIAIVGFGLFFIYAFFTGDTSFIAGSGTVDDCVLNPIYGGCD